MTEQIDWREKQQSQWLASRKIRNVEELETLPAGTNPWTSHSRSSRRERCGKRKRSTIFFEKTRSLHGQSDEHWNWFKGNVGEICQRQVNTVKNMVCTCLVIDT